MSTRLLMTKVPKFMNDLASAGFMQNEIVNFRKYLQTANVTGETIRDGKSMSLLHIECDEIIETNGNLARMFKHWKDGISESNPDDEAVDRVNDLLTGMTTASTFEYSK